MLYQVVDVITGDVVASGYAFEDVEDILDADDNVERTLKQYYDNGVEYVAPMCDTNPYY